MESVLKKILDKKKTRIQEYKNKYSINSLLKEIKNNYNFEDFEKKIKKRNYEKKISIIAEIKKASPSAGVIISKFNHLDIAKLYVDNGASFLSVLTEEDFFLGKLDYIKNIKDKFKIPILCKDFFIDTYQVALAKSYGADCILIILSAIDNVLAKDLYQSAQELNISTLVEVHTEKEAEISLSFENALIGINNRNLENLKISLETSIKLSKILNVHKNPIICESGIHSTDDLKFVAKNAGIINFLIGESILKSENIASKLKEFTQISL